MQLVLTQPWPVPGFSTYPTIAGMLWARFGDRLLTPMPRAEKSTTAAANWSELVQAISVRRDRAAFIQLFNHFAPRIKAYILRSGAREAAAEEIAQETMLSVWRKAETYDPNSAGAAAWIFTIARNLRIDAIRREKWETPIKFDPDEGESADLQIDERPTPEAAVAASQLEISVRKALEQLPSDQLRVIELSFFQDVPHGDIAEQLQIPLGTVKSRVRLALSRLRTLIGDAS